MPPQNTEQARWFDEEVLPHEPALRGYLRREFPRIDHDDVVQESYLKLLRNRTVGPIASTRAYLFVIARNTARTFFRRRRIFSDEGITEAAESAVARDAADSAGIANARHQRELVVAAIDGLPRRCREVIELTVLNGLSCPEVAERLGIAESTVRVQLARGIKKCAGFMREQGERT